MSQSIESRTVGGEIVDELRRDMERRQRELRDSMKQFETPPERSIPLDLFTTNFLEWMSGRVKDDGVLRQNWITIAGSIFERVSITNPDGSVFAIVPPLCDRNALKTLRRDQRADHVLAVTQMKSDILPHLANNMIRNALNARYKGVVQPTTDAFKQEWKDFLARFDAGNEKAIGQSKPDTNNSDIEYVYE